MGPFCKVTQQAMLASEHALPNPKSPQTHGRQPSLMLSSILHDTQIILSAGLWVGAGQQGKHATEEGSNSNFSSLKNHYESLLEALTNAMLAPPQINSLLEAAT